jgi:pyruvate formate lyase activating enzyme
MINDINIKGVQKFSMIDYPGKLSCVVFLNKCNMRCGYCHNPELVFSNDSGGRFPNITPEEFFNFLDEKKSWLDGVCITGGEPTLHPGLLGFMKNIKDKGYTLKIDTNGSNPGIIQKIIDNRLADYVAMDVKNSIIKYPSTANTKVPMDNIISSIDIIREAGKKNIIDYEFRTTILPRFIEESDIKSIGEMLKGSKKYVLQQFKPEESLVDDNLRNDKTYNNSELEKFRNILKEKISDVEIRQ